MASGNGVLDASLLDAIVDDPGEVIRQRQVCIGLHEQQRNGEQDQGEIRFDVTD